MWEPAQWEMNVAHHAQEFDEDAEVTDLTVEDEVIDLTMSDEDDDVFLPCLSPASRHLQLHRARQSAQYRSALRLTAPLLHLMTHPLQLNPTLIMYLQRC